MHEEIIKVLAIEMTQEYRHELSEYRIKKDFTKFRYTSAKIRNCSKIYREYYDDDRPVALTFYTPIISYETCTAIADDTNKVFYEIGKWSRTTSRQMTQIYNEYYRDYQRVLIV